ncbi:hypothetical protein WMF18_29740 [Sorangium sp. So ce315]|uniref:hypothetical protein n=1 Tax=Sorangium sp. So ce315 TaxID=3133299 RepID=UPI003F629696
MRADIDSPPEVSEAVSAALHRLSRGFLPSSAVERRLSELHAASLVQSLVPKALRVDGDALLVVCDIESPGESLSDVGLDELSRLRLSGRCQDGSTFSARVAFVKSLERKTRRLVGAVLSCDEWAIERSTARLLLWVGVTDAELPPRRGNLRLSRGRELAADHYQFQGQSGTCYLIRCEPRPEARWLFALEPRSAEIPDLDALGRDLMTIAFCFGHPFRVGLLHGLGEDGDLAGAFRTGAGEPSVRRLRRDPPVPQRAVDPPWPAALFEAISGHLARGGAREAALTEAMKRYLEALHEPSTEGRALKLLQGARAAATALLGEERASKADRKRWEDWLSQNRALLEAHAGGAPPDELLDALRRPARDRASGVIRSALSSVDLPVLLEMEAALASAEASLFGEGPEPGPDERSTAILRTLLVALVASAVGYQGPISGWERPASRRSYDPASPWWPVDGSAADRVEPVTAVVPERGGPTDVRELWPHFGAPKVPIQGLIATVASFAEGLEARTNGAVVATVKPLPQGPRELALFELVMAPAGRPTAQRLLLTIEDAGNGRIRITGWDEKPRPFSKEAQLISFLNKLANRAETHELVQELMILEQEPPEP